MRGQTDQGQVVAPPVWRVGGALALGLTVLMALAYGGVEWARTGTLRDGMLILLVAANAAVIYRFGLRLAPDLGALMPYTSAHGADPQAGVSRLMGSALMPVAGATFGVLIGAGAWFMDPWAPTPDSVGLRPWLAGFIGVANILTGMAIWAIMRFWRLIHRETPYLDLRILNLSRDPLTLLLRINSQIVTQTAVVASLAIIAVVLAGYQAEPLVILFSCFALLVVIATYAVPVVPLSNRLRVLKGRELGRLEARIAAIVGDLDESGDNPADRQARLDTLLAAQAHVSSIPTLPPGG